MRREITRYNKLALGACALIAILAASGCGKKNKAADVKETETQTISTQQSKESETKTDIVTVTLKDKDGRETVVEGVATLNDDGSATVTVKDKDGKEMVLQCKARRDNAGKLQVSDPIVVYGDTISDDKGNSINVVDSSIEEVEGNNDGTEIADNGDSAESNEQQDDTDTESNVIVDDDSDNESTVHTVDTPSTNNDSDNNNSENEVINSTPTPNSDSAPASNSTSDPEPVPAQKSDPTPVSNQDPVPTPNPTPTPEPAPQPEPEKTPEDFQKICPYTLWTPVQTEKGWGFYYTEYTSGYGLEKVVDERCSICYSLLNSKLGYSIFTEDVSDAPLPKNVGYYDGVGVIFEEYYQH